MDDILGFLLGSLHLFYPLLIASGITFVYGICTQSWVWLLISGILLFPDAWYFSGYPPYPYAKWVPLIQLFLALIFYLGRLRKRDQSGDRNL